MRITVENLYDFGQFVFSAKRASINQANNVLHYGREKLIKIANDLYLEGIVDLYYQAQGLPPIAYAGFDRKKFIEKNGRKLPVLTIMPAIWDQAKYDKALDKAILRILK